MLAYFRLFHSFNKLTVESEYNLLRPFGKFLLNNIFFFFQMEKKLRVVEFIKLIAVEKLTEFIVEIFKVIFDEQKFSMKLLYFKSNLFSKFLTTLKIYYSILYMSIV